MRLPGDKSISHRALMLAALANGPSRLTKLASGSDVQATRRCLQQCGIMITTGGEVTVVEGRGGAFDAPQADLDCGNSGTTARLLAGLLAGRGIAARITGDASLSRRPMERITVPLRQLGANIAPAAGGTLPLDIRPVVLGSLDYTLPVPSAQVKSALLLAGLASEGIVTVREPVPTRDHTEIMLRALGIDTGGPDDGVTVSSGRAALPAFDLQVPGDASSAAFLVALAVLVPGAVVSFEHLLLNPTRLGFYRTLQRMGGHVTWSAQGTELGESVGQLSAQSSGLRGIALAGDDIPAVIDELPILAVLATQAVGETVVRDAGELRYKESDRLTAICENIARLGGEVERRPDGVRSQGPTPLTGAPIATYGDHRIAMAFAVAGHIASGDTILDDPDCVEVSLPGFHELARAVTMGREAVES